MEPKRSIKGYKYRLKVIIYINWSKKNEQTPTFYRQEV